MIVIFIVLSAIAARLYPTLLRRLAAPTDCVATFPGLPDEFKAVESGSGGL